MVHCAPARGLELYGGCAFRVQYLELWSYHRARIEVIMVIRTWSITFLQVCPALASPQVLTAVVGLYTPITSFRTCFRTCFGTTFRTNSRTNPTTQTTTHTRQRGPSTDSPNTCTAKLIRTASLSTGSPACSFVYFSEPLNL